MSNLKQTIVDRREYLAATATSCSVLALAGCSGFSSLALEVTDETYTPNEPEGYGIATLTVKNNGPTTNVRAYIDLIAEYEIEERGVEAGEVFETYDRTEIINEGKTAEISVVVAHYLQTGAYELSTNVEPTDRPHASFETEDNRIIKLDASNSDSVESSITSYNWEAREEEWPEYGEKLDWGIPTSENIKIRPPDPYQYNIDILLTVEDENGKTDKHSKRVLYVE